MKKFEIEIIEVLNRIVEIEATTEDKAINKVKKAYRNEEIVLDYNDLVETTFEVINKTDNITRNEKLYVCPKEGCDYETHWTFDDVRTKGEPVCPNCDEDLVQACEICHKPEDDDGRCNCTNKDAHGI